MAAKVLPAPHSTSHSPIGSPRSSRTHVLHTSSGSQDTFTATTRLAKRKSWQTPNAPYVAESWVDTTSSGHWEAVSAEDWSSGAAAADVTQMTGHRALMPNQSTNISHDEHLAPRLLDDASHKYSPASSARNSVQSTSVTTPSLMGSMDSSNDIGGSTTAEGAHEQSYYYASPLQPIPAPSQGSTGYPQLTLQTSHLPQPQSPSGGYGAHYMHNPRNSYPSSRDYRYSYDQMSYTSPTVAVPPQTLFSPVLQHPHGVNHHDYFVRPQSQVFYADYVTSPTTAVPPSISGMYYAAQPQPITWNQPITPSIGQVHSPVNTMGGFRRQNSQGQVTLLNHPPQYQSPTATHRGSAVPPGIQPNQFISPPQKLSSHLPSKSVPLPARGKSSAAARVQSTVNMGQQSAQATGRHGRREQRDSAPLHRSSLLEDFRSNRNKRWELQEIQGHVAEFSSDQHGSRFIQHKLVTAPESTRNMVYREIIPSNVHRLARDVFGNYVLQKLCELGTPEERATIARTLQGHLVTLALDMYGCRVLQKMIDYLSAEDQSRWVAELSGHILQCVKDANGNHVIQKFLESPLSQHSVFITTFRGHVYELATHPYGCRVLQRCFEHVKPELVRPLLNELHQRTLNLMQDQYGNYVMQFILEKGFAEDKNRVIQNLTGHMLPMSKHKFASNVCEKALISASAEQRRVLINEISLQRPDGMKPMITMIKDQYANYVLQRALTIAEGDALEGLLTALKPQLLSMRHYTANSPFTKHILAVEKILRVRNIDITAREFSPVTNNNTGNSPTSGTNSDSTTTPTMQVTPGV